MDDTIKKDSIRYFLELDYYEAANAFKCQMRREDYFYYKISKQHLNECSHIFHNDKVHNNGSIYVLFGQKIYVGQAGFRKNGDGLMSRLKEHKRNYSDWETAFILASKTGFTSTELDYLENCFYTKLKKIFKDEIKKTIKNKQRPQDGNPDARTEDELKPIVEKSFLLMQMYGRNFIKAKEPEKQQAEEKANKTKTVLKFNKDPHERYRKANPEIQKLYDDVVNFFTNQDGVVKRELKQCDTFSIFGQKDLNIGSIIINNSKLIILLKLDPAKEKLKKGFSRSLAGKSHWGTGNFEITIRSISDFEKVKSYIRKAHVECYPYYFAYGSNLNIEQMNKRCNKPRLIGTTFVENYRLAFRYNGNQSSPKNRLTIEKAKGIKVPIAVYQITGKDKINLDTSEGVRKGCYKLQIFDIKISTKNGSRKFKAFSYVMPKGRPFAKPDANFTEYVKIIRAGYKYFGFDEKLLDEAIKDSEIKQSSS